MRRAKLVALYAAGFALTVLTVPAALLALVGVFDPVAWVVVQSMRVGDSIRTLETPPHA